MWEIINNNAQVLRFMEKMSYFHDSCIKEISYISGAYVDNDLSMHPINDQRILRVIIQSQSNELPMIEMEFQGLKYFKLFPVDTQYTCEILGATLTIKDGNIYWCDGVDLLEKDLDNYIGTSICALNLRWRSVDNNMGRKEFYHS